MVRSHGLENAFTTYARRSNADGSETIRNNTAQHPLIRYVKRIRLEDVGTYADRPCVLIAVNHDIPEIAAF